MGRTRSSLSRGFFRKLEFFELAGGCNGDEPYLFHHLEFACQRGQRAWAQKNLEFTRLQVWLLLVIEINEVLAPERKFHLCSLAPFKMHAAKRFQLTHGSDWFVHQRMDVQLRDFVRRHFASVRYCSANLDFIFTAERARGELRLAIFECRI